MKARQIEVFRTLMRCGTVTSAARTLNISQPALSQILLHTEDELGFKLFRRIKGRLIPSAEAEELFPEADRLFGDLENLRRFAKELRHGNLGTVRLAVSAPPALSFVPHALSSFRQKHGKVKILSYVVPADGLIEMLDRGQVGLGIAMTDRTLPMIDTETIGQSELVCVLPIGHRLAQKDRVSARDLEGEALISYRRETLPAQLLEAALSTTGERLRPEMEIDVSIIALSFVQQGLGIAIVDGLIPWDSFPGVLSKRFDPLVCLPICILTSTRRPLSRNHELLRQELRGAVQAPNGAGIARMAPVTA